MFSFSRRKILDIAVIVAIVALVFYSFGPNYFAQWGMIDDHEIFYFIQEPSRLTLSGFFSAIQKTEIFKFGEYPRYRPGYYIIRLLECALWGKNPGLWYGFRIVSLAVCLVAVYKTLRAYFPLLIAALLTFSLLRLPFWHDVLIRLGPAEFYGAIGLTAFLVPFNALIKDQYRTSSLILFLFGGLICFGVKENFILLYLFTLWLVADKAFTKRLTWGLSLVAAFQGIFCLIIATSVYLATKVSKVDIYANDITLAKRLKVFSHIIDKTLLVPSLIMVALIAAVFFIDRYVVRKEEKITYRPLMLALLCLVFYCGNYIFYNGGWPLGNRYDFPAILVPGAILSILYYVFSQLARKLNLKKTEYVFCAALVFALVIFNKEFFAYIKHYRDHAAGNQQNTTHITGELNRMAERAKKSPQRTIIVTSGNSAGEYEFIFSYFRFFRAMSVKNPIAIEFVPSTPPSNPLALQLDTELHELSAKGNEDFQPLKEKYRKCFSLLLSGASRFKCSAL